MSDSVSKNIKIAELIASSLNTSHIPMQLLCNAHPVESIERSCFTVIDELETKFNLKDRFIKRLPSLASFLSNNTCVLRAIEAITLYVSNTGVVIYLEKIIQN